MGVPRERVRVRSEGNCVEKFSAPCSAAVGCHRNWNDRGVPCALPVTHREANIRERDRSDTQSVSRMAASQQQPGPSSRDPPIMTAPMLATLPRNGAVERSPTGVRPVARIIHRAVILRRGDHQRKPDPNRKTGTGENDLGPGDGPGIIRGSRAKPTAVNGTRRWRQIPLRSVMSVMSVMSGRMTVMIVSLRPRAPGTSHQTQHCQATHNQREFLRHDEISGHRNNHSPARPGQEQPERLQCTRHADSGNHVLFSQHCVLRALLPSSLIPEHRLRPADRRETASPVIISEPESLGQKPIPTAGRRSPRYLHLCGWWPRENSLPAAQQKSRHSQMTRVTAQKPELLAETGQQMDHQP